MVTFITLILCYCYLHEVHLMPMNECKEIYFEDVRPALRGPHAGDGPLRRAHRGHRLRARLLARLDAVQRHLRHRHSQPRAHGGDAQEWLW